ncbi:MAG: NADH-quinone oxidoreductase subunit L, partial [Burkholderiales bacterium]
GIGLIAAYAGTLSYAETFAKAGELAKLGFPGTGWQLITVICICLFIGAMGKSAQFPLHVWLPDSMEGPTPISALIHAATMVTAGIFMVARMSPLFELSDTALSFILVVGAITALFMGFLGIIQNDIKRVVAYSTLSQLGYMTVALGASAYSVAVFHLMTHAFFKALLFLAAGSVIMGAHHNQDIRWMGGMRKYMPITWITALLGSLALIGTPLFAGFYSKDSIIEAVHFSKLWGSGFAYVAVLAGVFVTAFYSFRMYFLVFHGKERFDQNPDAHHDDGHGHDDHGHGHEAHKPHESPWVVTAPLLLLAFPSVVIGFLAIEPMLYGEFLKDAIAVDNDKHPAMANLAREFHGAAQMALHGLMTAPFWLAVAGVALSYYMYMVNPALPAAIKARVQPIYTLLENKYYMDWFNENVLARGARALGFGLWKGGDEKLIDGTLVNGSWKVVGWFSGVARRLQSGYIYHYALAMILGVFVLMTWFVWLRK